MSAMAFECQNQYLLAGNGIRGSRFISWLTSLIVFSKRESKQSNAGEPENAFEDYLDGYFNSFDFYPVCTRQLFQRNDAYALWQDFVKVKEDLLFATNQLVSDPVQHLRFEGLTNEEIRNQNDEATKKAVEILVKTYTRSVDNRSNS
jgi:hypothetical protein